MNIQKIRKLTNQGPFNITQTISRTNSITIVKIPPTSSHFQAISNPNRGITVKPSSIASTGAIDPVELGSGARNIRRTKNNDENPANSRDPADDFQRTRNGNFIIH